MLLESQGLIKVKQLVEQKRLVERELGELKAQLEKAGFSSVSQMRKFDTLIQAQAKELSHLRQRLREGQGVCSILTQHLGDTTKAFEELLRANDIDYYMGQSFRDQLAQSSALAQRVNAKFGGSESVFVVSLYSLKIRPDAKSQKVQTTPWISHEQGVQITPCSFSCPFFFSYNLCSDLMKEHLREIRSLRQRLEDSIHTNDRLRQQLEEKLARTTTEKGNRDKRTHCSCYLQGSKF
uniref:Uncharacterized protein n=1 Tax=Pundamilia nyererei TaxID=303518 RepID=A0A3B4FAZ7_9CICH